MVKKLLLALFMSLALVSLVGCTQVEDRVNERIDAEIDKGEDYVNEKVSEGLDRAETEVDQHLEP